jgi:hypothetical protein
MTGWPPAASLSATLAVGWATVELDRAARTLVALLHPGTSFEDAPVSLVLGARCRIGRGVGPTGGSIRVVLLEPSTEGRLAAFLARSGEAWAAAWVPAAESTGVGAGSLVGLTWRPGPLGPERLESSVAIGGPFRLLVEAATIAS